MVNLPAVLTFSSRQFVYHAAVGILIFTFWILNLPINGPEKNQGDII